MAKKDWFYSEQIALLSTTNTIDATPCAGAAGDGDVALTATYDMDAGDYLVIWSFNLGMSVDVAETTARAGCCVDGVLKQIYRVASQDSGTRHTCFAFAYITGMTAGNHTFSVRYGVGSGAGLGRANIRQAHQLVVKMNGVPAAENTYTENLGSVQLGATYVDDVSVTFTPARAGDTWVLLANLNVGGVGTDLDDAFIKIVLDGTDITNREAHIFCHSVTPSERYPYWAVAVRTLTAASHTFKVQAKAGPISNEAIILNRRVMAFNLSRWKLVATQESDGEETFNDALPIFVAKTNPLSYTPTQKMDHAWICGWLTNFTDATLAGANESHVGVPTDLETQLHDDRAAAGSTTEYFTSGLLYHRSASQITPGTSPGAMEDRVRWVTLAMDIKTKGYSGFVLRRPGQIMDPMHSGGMVVPYRR